MGVVFLYILLFLFTEQGLFESVAEIVLLAVQVQQMWYRTGLFNRCGFVFFSEDKLA